MGDPFHDPNFEQKWAEWHTAPEVTRQVTKVDFSKENRLWYYLGKPSTEAKPQYTENLALRRNNPKSNFMDTVRPPPPPVPTFERRSYPASYPLKPAPIQTQMSPHTPMQQQQQVRPTDRPYMYKPRDGMMNTWKSPSYNPGLETRKNPNSPVAHQPNVSYDHRTPAPQIGQPPYPAYHSHRPPQQQQYQYQPYVPPQSHSTSTWKHQSAASGPLLSGIDQYAHPYQSNQALPPYPYQVPASSQSPQQLSPLMYSSGAGPNVMPTYSPAGAHNRAIEAPSPSSHSQASFSNMLSNPSGTPKPPMYAISPSSSIIYAAQSPTEYLAYVTIYPYLKNAYLRRAKTYISPYSPGGGFTPEWKPKPTTSTDTAYPAIAPGPSSMSGPTPFAPQGYPQGHPSPAPSTARPTAQFQSPHDFQREMGRASQSASEAPKWNQLLQQLNTSTVSAAMPTVAAPSPHESQTEDAPPPLPSSVSCDMPRHPSMAENHTSSLPPPLTESQRPIPSPLSDVAKSPQRPECSPLSDDDKGTAAATAQDKPVLPLLQPSPPPSVPGTGAETWRYS